MGGLGGPAVNVRRAFTKGPLARRRDRGMTTEICNTLTAAGLGQSTAVSIGGYAHHGVHLPAQLMPLFEADAETRAIAIYSEPAGGRMEAELCRLGARAPLAASDHRVHGGSLHWTSTPGMRFGHAGTIVEGKADTTADKIERIKAAGISVAERIEDIPALVKERLRGH